MKITITAVLAAALGAIVLTPAHAQINLTLSGTGLTDLGGGIYSASYGPGTVNPIDGTLTNNSGQTLVIGTDNPGNTASWDVIDDSSFINNYELTIGTPQEEDLASGDSITFNIFNVDTLATAPPAGVDTITDEIFSYVPVSYASGPNSNIVTIVETVPGSAPVPEASSMVGLGLLLAAFGVFAVRGRRTACQTLA